ncbi:hypothetical protein GCM10010415_63590 [Streptomyces atrovirens]
MPAPVEGEHRGRERHPPLNPPPRRRHSRVRVRRRCGETPQVDTPDSVSDVLHVLAHMCVIRRGPRIVLITREKDGWEAVLDNGTRTTGPAR